MVPGTRVSSIDSDRLCSCGIGPCLWALSRDTSTQSTDFVYTVTEIATVGGHTNVGLAMSDGGISDRGWSQSDSRDRGALGGGSPAVYGASQTAGNAAIRALAYQNGVITDLGASLGGPNTACEQRAFIWRSGMISISTR
jgi:hypothetical protein